MKFDKIYHKKTGEPLEWVNVPFPRRGNLIPDAEQFVFTLYDVNGDTIPPEEILYYKSLLPPINRGLYDRLTRKRMEAYKNENYEDLNLSDMFELPSEFAGYETRRSMTMWTEYGGGVGVAYRPVLEEGELDEL